MAIELEALISGLVEETTPDPAADFLLLLDTSGSDLNKIKPQTILQQASLITALTAETTIAAGDYIMIWDASASALRKMARSDFVAGIGASSPLTLTAAAAGDVPLTSKGHASQTAHLQDWSNSAGTPLAYITKEGYMAVKTLASVTVPTLFSDGDPDSGLGNYGSNILTLILGGVAKVLLEGNEVRMDSNGVHSWNNTTAGAGGGGADTGITRGSAGFVKPTLGTSGAGGFHLTERTAPAAPATNNVLLYAQDNGSGKTQIVALFPTGAAQVIATEP